MSWDHPRSRGEYYVPKMLTWQFVGSSPLSRGILRNSTSPFTCWGIIPALAGNTFLLIAQPYPTGDHPRSRGEYPFPARSYGISSGSSPLSRGIQGRPRSPRGAGGIIPALAGNTNLPGVGCIWFRDHPRSRGEYPTRWSSMSVRSGSSPLSRGIPSRQNDGHHHVRIIPALAGNTASSPTTGAMSSDHPRSRGEYRSVGHEPALPGGSSPLSRGIPSLHVSVTSPPRIIPALAGNTRHGHSC